VDRSHRQKLGKRQDTGSDGDEDTDTRRQGTAHGPKRHAQWGRSGLRAGLKERSGAGGEESVQTVCSKHRRTHTHSVSARGTGGARWDRQLRGGAVADRSGRRGEEEEWRVKFWFACFCGGGAFRVRGRSHGLWVGRGGYGLVASSGGRAVDGGVARWWPCDCWGVARGGRCAGRGDSAAAAAGGGDGTAEAGFVGSVAGREAVGQWEGAMNSHELFVCGLRFGDTGSKMRARARAPWFTPWVGGGSCALGGGAGPWG